MSAKEDKSPRCNLSVPSNANSENQELVSKSQMLPREKKSVFSLKSSPFTYGHIYFKIEHIHLTMDLQLSRKGLKTLYLKLKCMLH